jgi:hypothetical protein
VNLKRKWIVVVLCTAELTVCLCAESCTFASTQRLNAPEDVIPITFFGMHIHGIDIPRPNTGKVTPWPSVPFGAWRLHDAGVTWRDLEPQRGRFQFARLDKYVALAEQRHVKLLLPLVGTPAWASARPDEDVRDTPKGSAAEPANIEDWGSFVRTVVERYRGRIEAYEIWNEPNMRMFWTGSVDELVALTDHACQVIKSTDPAALVVLPSATAETGLLYLDAFLKKGGASCADIVGYHFYINGRPPEAMAALAKDVRRVLRANNVNKPVWNTEAGWDAPKPFPSDDLAAAYVARSYLLLSASDIKRFYWYAWDNHGWVSLDMTESDNAALKPAAKAYAATERWLIGAAMRSCKSDAADNWTCELDRNGERQWIVWNSQRPTRFPLRADWHLTRSIGLLGRDHKVNGPEIQVGPIPTLLKSR